MFNKIVIELCNQVNCQNVLKLLNLYCKFKNISTRL